MALDLSGSGYALAHAVVADAEPPRLRLCEHGVCESPGSLQNVVTAAVKAHRLEGAPCALVLRPDRYSIHQIETPAVEEGELREAARWAVRDLVDFDVSDAVIDVFRVPQRRGNRIYVVAAAREAVRSSVKLIERAGLKLVAIDIAEMALRNLTSLLPASSRGVALLYATDRVGLLVFAKDGVLQLARTIEADLEPLADAAWQGAPDEKPEDAESLLSGMLLEIQRSLDFYEHGLQHDPIAELVIAPFEVGGSLVHEFIARNLTTRVSDFDVNTLVRCSEKLPWSLQARCLPAIGAALRPPEAGA